MKWAMVIRRKIKAAAASWSTLFTCARLLRQERWREAGLLGGVGPLAVPSCPIDLHVIDVGQAAWAGDHLEATTAARPNALRPGPVGWEGTLSCVPGTITVMVVQH